MSGDNVADGQIRSFYDRWLRLEEEKASVSTDLKELFAEAKGNGFDGKALRESFRRVRNADDASVQEHDALVDLYVTSLTRDARVRTREDHDSATNEGGRHETAVRSEHPVSDRRRHHVLDTTAREAVRGDATNDMEGTDRLAHSAVGEPVRSNAPTSDAPAGSAPIPATIHEPAPHGDMRVAADGDGPVPTPSAEPVASSSRAKATKGKAATVAGQHGQPATGMAVADGVASRPSDGGGTVAPIPPETVAQTGAAPGPRSSSQAGGEAVETPADHSKPNPWCRDPDDCGVYASWHFTCLACLRAKAAALGKWEAA